MNEERGLGAMPKLYGAPAYARPAPLPANPIDRPFDPDDLPLESERTDEDDKAAQLQPVPYESVPGAPLGESTHQNGSPRLRARLLRLRLPGRR